MKKKLDYSVSSGNVFEDLNLPNPEETLAKAELIRQISKTIKEKKITQKKAALLLGIDQPKVSALINGKLLGFSLERIIGFLNNLGQDITINIRPNLAANTKGNITVRIILMSETITKSR